MPLPHRVAELAGFDLLLSVARLGSIGLAAKAHGMSQPSASERIRRLESAVGVPLVARSHRGSRLTESGVLVADWARRAVEAATDLEAGIEALRQRRDSRLRVAASMTVAEYLVPRWLVGLRACDPHTTVALTSGNSVEVANAVLRDEADIGFIEGPDLPEGLQARTVGHDHLVLVVSPRHLWAQRAEIGVDELAATPLISRESGSGTRRALELAVQRQSDVELTPPLLELSSTTAIKAAVVQGMGPAVLADDTVAGELAAGTLVAVSIPHVNLSRTLRVVWPVGQRLQGPGADLARIAAAAQRETPRDAPRSA